ncbi:hypothetical protein C100_14670 [Sphingobium sp. C100]|jgi:SAM-dependent methyltransferase|uniref:class I SAM-dependent methyltransferase n=1 Tax=Sphingobium sp. C100 TaxID=1207055 RepID=UPI0003D5CA1A|nr:class I SAM-dependent methyltransferase [Sphingobium sp. C100]ETI63024.1 hypothetical protein C100_14670 [Sphingobium sp. C100]PHQ64447.1 MAG: class I SAM-dependent methyltransferase [Sphingobium sp.]
MTQYSHLSDEDWFAKIAGTESGTPLFPLPPESLQTSTVGRAGLPILRDAFMFWQFTRRMLEANNGIDANTKVMDFGCAWSRILRFWQKDLPPQNLYGFDVEERFLSIAREHVPGCNYTLSNARPPIAAADNSFDLIYAFSVFSHLPQDVADAWISEFARILKPGGIVCLTTRPRAHIEIAGNEDAQSAHFETYARAITHKESALERYDAGEFIFYPVHGGGGLAAETFGEAIIPPAYAKQHWKALDFVNFAQNYSETYLQPCFVMRKPH